VFKGCKFEGSNDVGKKEVPIKCWERCKFEVSSDRVCR